MKHLQRVSPAKQEGAALFVALMMVFMLTILGISAMRESTLEGQLVANAIQKEITFQAAESATDVVLSIEDYTNPESIEASVCQEPETFDKPELSISDAQVTTVTVEYAGQSIPVGYSLGGPIGGRRFVITGESTITGVSTHTTVSQGVVAIGAALQGAGC